MPASPVTPSPNDTPAESIPLQIIAVELSFAAQYVAFVKSQSQPSDADKARAKALLQQCRVDVIAALDAAAVSVGVDPLVGEQ